MTNGKRETDRIAFELLGGQIRKPSWPLWFGLAVLVFVLANLL